jgi:hypothetical protein
MRESSMLELILIAAVMVFIVSRLDARHFEQAKSQWGLGRAPAAATGAAPAPQVRPRLAIEGTQRPAPGSTGFVKGYGVDPRRLADLRVYAHLGRFEQFPESIRTLLDELHRSGCALGTGIMEIMFHQRRLAEGEAVYFALVDGGDRQILAFVDRLRTG